MWQVNRIDLFQVMRIGLWILIINFTPCSFDCGILVSRHLFVCQDMYPMAEGETWLCLCF